MWRPAAFVCLLVFGAKASAVTDVTARAIVEACGGFRIVAEPVFEATPEELADMADILEDRLVFVPDPLRNTQVVETAIEINLPGSFGRPSTPSFFKTGQIEVHLAQFVGLTDELPFLSDFAPVWDAPNTKGGRFVSLQPPVLKSGDIVDARAVRGHHDRFDILVTLSEGARARFARFTAEHVGGTLVVVLDGKVVMSAHLHSAIPNGQIAISGDVIGYGHSDMKKLAYILKAGALSHDLEILSWQRIPAASGDICAQLFSN